MKNFTKIIKEIVKKSLIFTLLTAVVLQSNLPWILPVLAQETTLSPSQNPAVTPPPAAVTPSPAISLSPFADEPTPTLPAEASAKAGTPQPTATPKASPTATPTSQPQPTTTPSSPSPTPLIDPAEIPFIQPTATPSPAPAFIPSSSSLPPSSATINYPLQIRPSQSDFKGNDQPAFSVYNLSTHDFNASVLDASGNRIETQFQTEWKDNLLILTVISQTPVKPGKYILKINQQADKTYTSEFTWGMLAVNTDKSVYLPGNRAELSLIVFNEKGEFTCKGDLELAITDPAGRKTILTTAGGEINFNSDCRTTDGSPKETFQTVYQTSTAGHYLITFSAALENKTHTISDSFEVKDTIPFEVKRKTVSQSFSPQTYPVFLDITANQDFSGQIIEVVPEGFSIFQTDNQNQEKIKRYDSVKILPATSKESVLASAIPINLRLPFSGNYPKTLLFGEKLKDPRLIHLYSSFGLVGHDGLDFGMPIGTPILAADSGEIILAEKKGVYGTTVVIQHSWGRSYYGHLSKIITEVGQKVSKGDKIALSGNTGITTGPHLHFGIKLNKPDMENGYYGKVDPLPFLTSLQIASDFSVKTITWNISLKKGETASLGYQYKAPLGNPGYFYLGPLQFRACKAMPCEAKDLNLVFAEERQWQVAIDAKSVFEGAGGNKQALSVIMHNPDTAPEDFFVELNQAAELELTAEPESAQNKRPAHEKIEAKRQEIKERLKDRILSVRKKDANSQTLDFLSYYLKEESDGSVGIVSRSKDGLQKYLFNTKDLKIELSEQQSGKKDFTIKAVSAPVFQYQNSKGNWQDYINFSANTLTIKEQTKNYVLLSQKFVLSATDALSLMVSGETEFKLGWASDSYINKLTFRLGENENINRLAWKNKLLEASKNLGGLRMQSSEVKESATSPEAEENRLKTGDLVIDWSDFSMTSKKNEVFSDEGIEPAKALAKEGEFSSSLPEVETTDTQASVTFYPEGFKGALEVDPTVSLSTPTTTIQIDVANRYRAIMETGDTTDYILFYDAPQSLVNATHEFKGPCILETNTYCLRDDANRITTILETDSSRAKIRVEGKFNNEAGTDYLDDESATPILLTAVVDYTFTTEGVFVENITDFKTTGVTLDAATTHNGYDWLGVYADVTDAAFDDAGNISYGDGNTEAATTTDGATIANTNTYIYLPGTGTSTYQDAFVGIQRAGWYDDTTGGTHDWYWDEGESGTQDLIAAQEQAHLTKGIHQAKWFFLMLPETSVDTEAERESYINDFRNPDILTYTTGSEWQDMTGGSSLSAPSTASPGLKFDGADDYVQINHATAFDFGTSTAFTLEAWVWLSSADTDDQQIWEGTGGAGADFWVTYDISQSALRGDIDLASSYCVVDCASCDPDNKWHHLALVYNRNASCTTSDILIYIDGALQTTTVTVSGVNTNVDVELGGIRFGDSNANTINGYGDEMRVWNDARTAAEIQQNMFKQIDPASSNLLGYWRFNENTGTTAYDETTNNLDGTLTSGPTWTTGYVPDHYNEAEGAYTIDASGNQVNADLDGGSNASTTANGAVTAATATVTVVSTTGFDASGTAYIDGDRFTYIGTTATTFTGVPTTGEDAVIGHATGTVVAQMNRHKPMYKIRGYQQNSKPSAITMEGTTLVEGTDYNLDYKPVSDAYFADELTWASTFENAASATSPDVGSAGTVQGTTTFPSGKYGNGALIDNNGEAISIPLSGNVNSQTGIIEFWYKNAATPEVVWAEFFSSTEGSLEFALVRWNSDTELGFCINAACATTWSSLPNIFNGSWYHIRLTYNTDGGTGAGYNNDSYHLYIDGIDQGEKTTDLGNIDIGAYNLYFGNDNTLYNDTGGLYDELRIYQPLSGGIDDLAQGGNTTDSSEYLYDDTNDYTLDFVPVDASNRGEYLYLGSDSMVSGFNVDLDTVGATAGSLNLDWEYWNGTSWTSLESITGFSDGTSNFTQDGAVIWTANPTNWRPYSVNGSTDLYYIRVSLNASSGTYTTYPIEKFIRTDMLIFQNLLSVTAIDNTQTLALPALIDLLRHGKWFNPSWVIIDGVERPFTF